MRIVLDTYVLVAGLLSPFGPPGEIVRMVSSGELMLCLDARALAAYDGVLHRPKFGFAPGPGAALLDFVEYRSRMVASSPLLAPLPDTDDEPLLEIAPAGGAECLVTGNVGHFPEGRRQAVLVVSPAGFRKHNRSRGEPVSH